MYLCFFDKVFYLTSLLYLSTFRTAKRLTFHAVIMKHTFSYFSVFCVFFILTACSHNLNKTITAEPQSTKFNFPASLKVNAIQVLGTHNSYARPVDTAVLNYVDPILQKLMSGYLANLKGDAKAKYEENHPYNLKMSELLAYDHPNFDEQLNAGIRSLEIDIYNDPTGKRFDEPAAYALLKKKGYTNLAPYDTTGLSAPGFKVMHIADLDFRTHYTTFQRGLKALKSWSSAHPKHIPIFIMVEAKDRGIPIFPNAAQVLPFDEQAYDALDKEIFDILGKENIITPDVVRGKYPTLEAGILANNWPLLSESLGKFIFLLLPTAAGLSDENNYVKGHPSLEGRAMFVQSVPGQSFAGFLLLDNALIRKTEIQDYVKKGYLVRTRADIDTYEAKVNDLSRAKAAFESGAQVVSTDFFKKGNAYGTDYVVVLPDGGNARINPINGSILKQK